jgi:serine/threonine protein kinase
LDIKGDNVVLTEELELAIIDFGYTCPAWDPNVDPCVGTAIYNPPEIELARQ